MRPLAAAPLLRSATALALWSLCLTATPTRGETLKYRLPVKIVQFPKLISDYPVTIPVALTEAYQEAAGKTVTPTGRFGVRLVRGETGTVHPCQYLRGTGQVIPGTLSFHLPSDGTGGDYWLYFEPEEAEDPGIEDGSEGKSKGDLLSGIPTDSAHLTLTEGWNSRAGSALRSDHGGVVFNIYRVTPAGQKEMSPHFVFEKVDEGPVLSAFLMRAKAGYDDLFLWLVYRKGGYRVLRYGGHNNTRMYWLSTIGKARYLLFSHDRFPIDLQDPGSKASAGRFCVVSVGDERNLLMCSDRRFHCKMIGRFAITGAWRQMFLRLAPTPFDDLAKQGEAIIDWIEHASERITFGKPEKMAAEQEGE